MEKEEIKKENQETKELQLIENENYMISDFGGLSRNTDTKTQVFTNITDSKEIFNLENNVDTLLNDCEGETIRVEKVLIKRYEKPLKEAIIDEETGEVLKDKEITMSCVLVDDMGKSYATGSKVFIIQLMRYLQMQANMNEKDKIFDIQIIKKKFGEKGNKALSFKLV